MSKKGPVLLVDDDADDQEIFKEVYKSLSYENLLRIFDNGGALIDYLLETSEKPFLIISDINMPLMSGLELRKKITENDYLRRKSIPFVFFSTAATPATINEAYLLTVQGFFQKDATLPQIKEQVALIMSYWKHCRHPNS